MNFPGHFFFVSSPGTAGVVVRHEAESIHDRSQLLKLLPAKHTWLPVTDHVRHKLRLLTTVNADSQSVGSHRTKASFLHLVTAGGITKMHSNRFAFKVSQMCVTKCTSSLCARRHIHRHHTGESCQGTTLQGTNNNSPSFVTSQLAPHLQGETVEAFRLRGQNDVRLEQRSSKVNLDATPPLQHPPARLPAPRSHLRCPARWCSPGKTSRRTRAGALTADNTKRHIKNFHH